MPSLNFKEQFASKVESGEKRCTIRAKGKRLWKVGDTAHCFTGMRTSKCRCLGRFSVVRVRDVIIDENYAVVGHAHYDGVSCRNFLAAKDGFDDYCQMRTFFRDTYGLPFEGQLIEWELR